MTDTIQLWTNGRTSDLVFGEAIRDMKNDALKLVKAARKELALCAALAANNTNQKAMDSLRTLLCGVGVVGEVDGHAVIRRASVIELVDQMRHA